MSKIYLILAINFIKDNFEKQNLNNTSLNILGKLYSIAYIKIYLKHYVDTLMNNNYQNLPERKEINQILFSEETIIAKEIKYYTLKLYLRKKNYEELLQNIKEDNAFEFKEYFQNIELKDSKIFFYSLLPTLNETNFIKYKEFYDTNFKEQQNQNEEKDLSLPKEIKKCKINDIIYTYLYFDFYKSYISDQKQNDLMKLNLNFLLKIQDKENEFIKLLFNNNPFITKVLPKLKINDFQKNKEKNKTKIEILFYAFRFVFNILCDGNRNNFFYQLCSKNAIKAINENMIPGKLSNTNDFIRSFEIIYQNFKKDPNYSAYLCSCGYHYTIDLCSFPTKEFSCPKCNQIIGGINHILHRREGHKRIFYNNYYKEKLLRPFYADKTIPYILLRDLETEVNNKKNELFKGLKKESKQIFLTRREKIREINYITFRILNFILHGFILFSNIREYLSDEYLNKNLIESMTCFDIMEKDWKIIDTELKIKQIPNVQVFMNVIFDKVLSLMSQQSTFKNDKQLNDFEKKIEIIINEALNNKTQLDEYIKNNNLMTDNIDISDKLIILENDLFNVNVEKKYPDMKYFKKAKLPKIKDLKKEFNSLQENADNYPILNYMLNENSIIRNLKYLPIINKLCNYIIKYCSYKFTREEARKIKIKEEIRDSDELINKFIEIYNKLRPLVKQIDCRELKNKEGELYFNELNNEQYLSNFCVDIGEFNYGYVLTGIYREMISWQNQFINVVLNSKNMNHKNYFELFQQEIMIQDCTENDIVKFPSVKEIMNEIIIKNSSRNNYGVINYNYGLIEEELASLILPSIKRFVSDNENCLRYVIYKFEGFRGNKSNIITRFIDKYKPKELNNDELKLILNYRNNNYNIGNNGNKKMTNFLFSLQILIDIILDNNCNKNELISNVIEESKQNENIEILNELFKNGKAKNLFTVDTLMNVFNIFEIICWDKIKDNLSGSYLMEINEENKKAINNFFANQNKDNNKKDKNQRLIAKRPLATAIRRFVSRYLSGKRGENDINENNKLMPYLSKQELWDDYGFIDNEEFDVELSMILGDEILVGQATNLFEYLGEDKTLIHEYFSKLGEIKSKNDNNNDNINNDGKINNKEEVEKENYEHEQEENANIEEDEKGNDDDEEDDDNSNNEITY